MHKSLLLLLIVIIWRVSVWGQCQTNIDFNNWSQEGYVVNGNWIVQGGGASVLQTINGDPTFYVSPDTFINVQISGKIRVENNFDDDFIGFVFGFREPDSLPYQYDLWLFDWKGIEQYKYGGVYYAQEGFTLSQITGIIPAGNNNYWPNFWGHDPSITCNPIATDYGPTKGWNSFTDYNFSLLYTPTRATIIVNNDTIFDVPGCYEPGRFGFYNYSQSDVRYSDFSYTLISNFEIENNNFNHCIDIPVNLLFTDSTCIGGTSITSNIASWDWDFGDGNTSTQINPTHIYSTPGSYPIKLVVTDVNDCQDSVTKFVTVHPPPPAGVNADSIFCPSDSVSLMASGGVAYFWTPATGLSNPNIANPMAYPLTSTTYAVTVIDQFGCPSEAFVDFLWFDATVNSSATICDGDSIMLGAGGGVQYNWTPTASLNDPSLANPLAFPNVLTTYQAIVTDQFGCMDTVYQTIQVNPNPIVTIGPDTTVCANQPVTFVAGGASTYSWTDELGNVLGTGQNQTLSFTSTSWIYVTGTDGNGCESRDSTLVNVFPLPIVDAGPDEAICQYENIMIGSSSNPAGTYSWSPAAQLSDPSILTPVFSPNSDGIFVYTLTLTDQNGCTNTDQMSITVHPFQLSETNSNVPCFGENTGTSTMILNATGPFIYTWLNTAGDTISQVNSNAPSASADSLFAGNYQAIAIDAFGCTDTIAIQIDEPSAPLSVGLTNLVDVDCFGNPNGEIHVTGIGGTPGYQYSIDGGFNFNNTGSFFGLGAAIYTIIVRDANLCETIYTDTVTTPTGLFAQITTIKHIDCFGANNGSFAIVAHGGSPPYQYSLDNVVFSNSLFVTNLSPGPDTVYFFDNNGCQVTLPFEIFEPAPLLANISDQKGIDCFGNDNGQIWISTVGGTAPYQFSLDGLNYQADSSFANLSGGADTLLIQDDSLCVVSIPFTIAEPPLLTTNVFDQKTIDCNGNSTGALVFDANGGTPAYQFSLDSVVFQSDSAFMNLIAGSYTVTVVDDSNCVSQLTVEITEPPVLELFNAVQANVDCYGNDSGFILLNGEGGTLPYQFSLDSLNFQSDSLFQNLMAGNYTFWIVDDSSCDDTISVVITEPDSLELLVIEQIDIDCFGNDNGSLLLAPNGGIGPYLLGLDGGMLQIENTFESLTPGVHTVLVQDDSSCVTELDVSIFEPPLLEINVANMDVTCFGFDDGTGTVTIEGGTPLYEIEWDSPSPQSTAIATNLGPGSYQVLVTDENGCMETAGIDIFEPDTLTLAIVAGSIVDAYCNWDNGEAAVAAAGGLGEYVFRWEGPSFREGAAVDMLFGDTTYTAIVTDGNGCETAIPVYIPQTPPAIPVFASNPTFEDSILLSQSNVSFLNQSIGAVTYAWDFGDGGLSDEEHPQHKFYETGVYEVTLTAYNEYFVCPTDTTITIHIIPDGALYIPNAFSPNDDGHNDFFYLMGEGLIDYQVDIFNRWGRQIAVLSNLADQWDGRDENGQSVPEGVYVYRVSALFNNGDKVKRGGTITLIR